MDAVVIGNAGWLIPRKRFDVFLRVAAGISRAVKGATFVIAGDGPERRRLKELSRSLGLQERVHWLGWATSGMEAFFRSLDVFLFNSDQDSFPTAPLEAMSYAIPVVASLREGGLDEVIVDDACGILLRHHDETLLVDHVVRLVQDREHLRRVGAAGRKRVGEVCDLERAVTRRIELLSGVARR
jgi:glycosyltransferase involved in cell wall biosynthesis